MYNFGSFDAFIVKPTILPEICSTILITLVHGFSVSHYWVISLGRGFLPFRNNSPPPPAQTKAAKRGKEVKYFTLRQSGKSSSELAR